MAIRSEAPSEVQMPNHHSVWSILNKSKCHHTELATATVIEHGGSSEARAP
jgi:hypothetical protein